MDALPRWFKVVAVAALLWSLLGCLALWMDLRLAPGDIAALPEAQQALYAARPGWAVAATAVAVGAGTLGSLGLLLRRKWAMPLLFLSLAGILFQDVVLFLLVDCATLSGMVAVVIHGLMMASGICLALCG